MVTPISNNPRALLPSLRALPSLSCPPALLPITLLHSTIPSLVSTSLPLFFRTWLRIDPIHTPSAYSVSAFLISLCELFVKLPLETVLRRGHVSVLSNPPLVQSNKRATPLLPLHTTGLNTHKFKTIIPTGPYRGVIGSMLYIVYEEGTVTSKEPSESSRSSSRASMRGRQPELKHTSSQKRGQGLRGLWRGWRVGFWGIVGMYTAAGLGGSGSGGEF